MTTWRDLIQTVESILGRTALTPEGCRLWVAGCSKNGYGTIHDHGRTTSPHRVIWELANGPIPPGWHIDHDCHNQDKSCNLGVDCPHRRCCELSHLRCVPPKKNILAGRGEAARNSRKTHCPRGHPYSAENTYRWKTQGGYGRICRVCSMERDRRRRGIKRINEILAGITVVD